MKPLPFSQCIRLSLVVLSFLLFTPSHADLPAFTADQLEEYDRGKYGLYPTQQFRSNNYKAPRPLVRTFNPQCHSDSEYFFMAIRGPGMKPEDTGPAILDTDGQLIWRHTAFPSTYNFLVQEYKGAKYLTFWSGNDRVKGHGNGFYYMLDQEYRLVRTVGAVNGLAGDLHEFTITPQNTCLFTIFSPTEADLGGFHIPKDPEGRNWIWDPVIQEINCETDELLFEWRGSQHINFADSYKPPMGYQGTNFFAPWDFFHMNSIEKDAKGNYLVSGRYYGLIYISGRTGDILWYFGGVNNNFTDLSYGTATNMRWQHHARWRDDQTAITLFDNNAEWGGGINNKPSRAMKIRVNQEEMTAKIIYDIVHPEGMSADAQGSHQILPNGNIFAGYGSIAAFTEFTPEGEVVCDYQYSALHAGRNGAWTGGAIMSYRTFRQQWSGTPHYNPWVAFDKPRGEMFVSWNGATEVGTWLVEGSASSSPNQDQWSYVTSSKRQGYETRLEVPAQAWRVLRLSAVDKHSSAIRCWTVFPGPLLKQTECAPASTIRADVGSPHFALIGAILLCPILFLLWRYGNRMPSVALPNRQQLYGVKEKAHFLVDRVSHVGRRFSTEYRDGREEFFVDDEEISDDETTRIDSIGAANTLGRRS